MKSYELRIRVELLLISILLQIISSNEVSAQLGLMGLEAEVKMGIPEETPIEPGFVEHANALCAMHKLLTNPNGIRQFCMDPEFFNSAPLVKSNNLDTSGQL